MHRGCGSLWKKFVLNGAPIKKANKYYIDSSKCVGCARCIAVCPRNAIKPDFDGALDDLCEKNCWIYEGSSR